MRIAVLFASLVALGWCDRIAVAESPPAFSPGIVRLATYNVSLYRNRDGELVRDLTGGRNPQARKIAEVIQRVRPDVILLNEFDFDTDGAAIALFQSKYLQVGQNGQEPIHLEHMFSAPVNTGVPTEFDLDHDGRFGGPADAIGYGRHPGQYGMVVLSKYRIDLARVRTFQNFLWKDMPEALLPVDPKTGNAFYSKQELKALRLSSKSLWVVPIELGEEPNATVVHLICSHPTPPVFDGPEDRNGRRNHDEIRLLANLIDPANYDYLVDDQGQRGGLPAGALFVVAGDLNADPVDGESRQHAVMQLLRHSRIDASLVPSSKGAVVASRQHPQLNSRHVGNPSNDTADFSGDGHGNLRVDYLLPAHGLNVVATSVFWPKPGEPGGDAITATDHRLVWLDIEVKQE